jgi:hypothetical protein
MHAGLVRFMHSSVPNAAGGNYNPLPSASVPAERLACHHSQRIGKTLTKMIAMVTKKKFF